MYIVYNVHSSVEVVVAGIARVSSRLTAELDQHIILYSMVLLMMIVIRDACEGMPVMRCDVLENLL